MSSFESQLKADRVFKGKILIMDDEEMIRSVAQKMLEFLGYTVLTAKNGEEALVAYQEQVDQNAPFDGIILDWTVQDGMNGAQTLAALLKLNPKAKCLLSSGMDNAEAMNKAKALGFCGSISKPYDIKSLDTAINAMLGL